MVDRGPPVVGSTEGKDILEGISASRLLYREDDDNFKRRLNTAIQMSWVYTTAVSILVCVLIFYYLEYNLVMGIILGILLALMSNFHLTLSRVTSASRWEIYKNRVVMPKGFRGGHRTISFDDIEAIERKRGLAGEVMEIRLVGGESFQLDVEEQQKPVAALELAFRQYGRRREGSLPTITIPVAGSAGEDKGP
jgi:hypothetical protein